MALTDQAPYGPTESVVRVLETFRDTGLGGSAIDVGLMARLGMGDEIARRVVQSLRLLGLIDDDGKPTETFIAFKQAPSDSYKSVLAEVLYDAYASVFAVTGTDLRTKSTTQIEDAFRPFKPDSLRKRMVSLFLGLCQFTGLIDDVQRGKPGPKAAPSSRAPTASKATTKPHAKAPSPSLTPPPSSSAPQVPLHAARERYVELLIEKAQSQDDPPAELLDRIERALGIVPSKEDPT